MLFFQVFISVMSVIITGIAAHISWQQHKTAQDKVRLDLYERRFRVYRGLMDLLSEVLKDTGIGHDVLAKYYKETNEKRFLFDKDVLDYMEEIRGKTVELRQLQRLIDPAAKVPEDRRSKAVDEESDLLLWFDKQAGLAAGRFEKYLSFKHFLQKSDWIS